QALHAKNALGQVREHVTARESCERLARSNVGGDRTQNRRFERGGLREIRGQYSAQVVEIANVFAAKIEAAIGPARDAVEIRRLGQHRFQIDSGEANSAIEPIVETELEIAVASKASAAALGGHLVEFQFPAAAERIRPIERETTVGH